MYQPKKYQKKDTVFIFEFIQEHPFANFVINGDRLLATHIPILTEGNAENFRFYGHIANHNEQFKYLKNGIEALIIFQGAHSYVSSSWYQKKDISTWDYSAVHINAKIKLQTEAELENSLQKLVSHFEESQEKPLYYNDIPQQILAEHLPQITGFWCEPFKVEAIAKLHQGYGKKDIESVIKHLEKQDNSLSNQTAKNIKKEFDKNRREKDTDGSNY